MRVVPSSPHPGEDLRFVAREGLAHEGHLLTAGERFVVERILALPAEPLELYARLTGREGDLFFLDELPYAIDLPAAAARLVDDDLAGRCASTDSCLRVATLGRLAQACRGLGLPASGPRAVLEARLRGVRWLPQGLLTLRHRPLLRRLERFAFGRPLDRSVLVRERIGSVRFASYIPTGGVGLHPTRSALRRWERARSGAWAYEAEPEEIARRGPDGSPRCAWRYAVREVLTRDPSPELLQRVLAQGAAVRVDLARALEARGALAEALEVCVQGSPVPEEDVALVRTGRRLSKLLGKSWAPRTLLEAPTRTLRLPAAPGRRAGRPLWRVEGERTVEDAVCALPALRIRGALHAENALWTTLYALCLADLYWLPVPGMLPTPRRDGPLDVGTPGFAARRAAALEARLRQLEAEGPGRWVAAWQGERLAGLSPGLVAVANSVPGATARGIVERLAQEGWSAAQGLPDLWIPPGPAARVEESLPATLSEGGLLVEIKGPGDALQDAQRAWHHHLVRLGIPVETWMVRPTSVRFDL